MILMSLINSFTDPFAKSQKDKKQSQGSNNERTLDRPHKPFLLYLSNPNFH